MYAIVSTWLQRSRDLENIMMLYNIGQYHEVYKNISNHIKEFGYENTHINHIFLHAKAAMEISHSREAIQDLTYILNNNSKFKQQSIRSLRSQAYLNIGEIQNAIDDAYKASLPLKLICKIKKAAFLLSYNSHNQHTIDNLLELCPESTKALMIAAKFYRSINNDKMFYRLAKIALEYEPHNQYIISEIVHFYLCNKNYEDAKILLRLHLNQSENQYNNYIDTETCMRWDVAYVEKRLDQIKELRESKNYEEAFVGLKDLIQMRIPRAFYERAKLFIDIGCLDCARSDLKRAQNYNDSIELLASIKKQSPCEILGLESKCNRIQALRAYKDLTRHLHPDLYHTPLSKFIAEKRMKKMNKALDQINENPFSSLFGNGGDTWLIDEDGAHLMKIRLF